MPKTKVEQILKELESQTFEKVESRPFAFTVDVKQAFEEVVRQFPNPEKCFRELVQNSIDAISDFVKIGFEYNWNEETAYMTVEDNGKGMNHKERDGLLLKLFASDKIDDPKKIGKFGIGFKSVFALSPLKVIVESGRNNENWKTVIDENYSLKLYKTGELKGTKVTLVKKIWNRDFENLREAAYKEVTESCGYSKTPILFDGSKINRPFDLPEEKLRQSFNEDGIDGVVALTSGNDEYSTTAGLYNNYFYVKDLTGAELGFGFDYGFKILINSPFVKLTLSRNDIIYDKNYQKMLYVAKSQTDKLFNSVFDRLANSDNSQKLWEFASSYISHHLFENVNREKRGLLKFMGDQKKPSDLLYGIRDSVAKAQIFETVYGERMALSDIVQRVCQDDKIYIAEKSTRITDYVKSRGKLVLKSDDNVRMALQPLAGMVDVNESFYVPKPVDQKSLAEEETNFLLDLKLGLRKIIRKGNPAALNIIDNLQFGSYDPKEGIGRDEPFYTSLVDNDLIIINKDNEYVKSLINLSLVRPKMAQYYAVQSVIYFANLLDSGKTASRIYKLLQE